MTAVDRAGSAEAFAAAVRAGSEPETSARRNLPTLALTFATVRSATERRRVPVAELLDELPEDLR
jgi:predicted dehydrogenase